MLEKSLHIILSKSKNKYAESLHLSIPHSVLIYDDSISDESMSKKGFRNMTKSIKSPCSWEKSFYFLSENKNHLDRFDHLVFIEDDVFSKEINSFDLFEQNLSDLDFDLLTHEVKTKEESKDWYWWGAADKNHFKSPIKSFNPFCVLSRRLVQSVLEFRERNKTFLFHEIMFPSLSDSLGYTTIGLESLPFYSDHFGRFVWRPLIKQEEISDNRIYHSVKPTYD